MEETKSLCSIINSYSFFYMSLSSKHHYIPKFYLSRFANEKNELAIFDKSRKVLKKGYYSTSSHFFEKNRNTFYVKDDITDDLEKVYQSYDSQLAEFFNSIENRFGDKKLLTPINILHIKMFIAVMFWRIPESDSLVDKYFATVNFDDLGLKITDEKGNQASIQIKNELLNKKYFRQMYRSFYLPLRTFTIFFKDSELSNWHYYITENEYPHLCCDNPIIFKNVFKFFNFEDDVIFPLTKNITIVFTRNFRPKVLSKHFSLDYDLTLFAQANKYVCSSDREYLKAVSDLYYTHYKNDTLSEIKEKLFSHISKNL